MKNCSSLLPPVVTALVICLASCAYDGESPAYDTEDNPKGFPQQAVALLSDIESGRLASLDSLTGRFSTLYTADPLLLDNEDWREVIQRLGHRLAYKAEQALANHGDSTTAATYYYIAAMAEPDSEEFSRRRDQLSTYLRMNLDTTLLSP